MKLQYRPPGVQTGDIYVLLSKRRYTRDDGQVMEQRTYQWKDQEYRDEKVMLLAIKELPFGENVVIERMRRSDGH